MNLIFAVLFLIYMFIAQHNTELDFFLLNLRVPIKNLQTIRSNHLILHKYAM